MTKTVFSVLTILYLTSCSSGQVSIEKSQSDTANLIAAQKKPNMIDTIQKVVLVSSSADSLKSRLKGLWTDGTTETATLEIKDKTIYYVDQGVDYRYSVNADFIIIKYPDYTYKAKLSFQSDTLIMDSEEYGETKLWRFKN